jgi:hypothetical protein
MADPEANKFRVSTQPCRIRDRTYWPKHQETWQAADKPEFDKPSGLSDHLVDLDCGELHPDGASRFLPKLGGNLIGLALVLLAVIPPAQALAAYPALLRRIMRAQRTQTFVWAHHAGQ